MLVLLVVPLLSLMSLLLVLGSEGTRVYEMTHALALVANNVSAVVFCRGHGSPAPRNSVVELERARLAAWIADIMRRMSAIPKSGFSR